MYALQSFNFESIKIYLAFLILVSGFSYSMRSTYKIYSRAVTRNFQNL